MTEYNCEHFPFPSFVFLFVARVMASGGKDLKGSVFLEALAERTYMQNLKLQSDTRHFNFEVQIFQRIAMTEWFRTRFSKITTPTY